MDIKEEARPKSKGSQGKASPGARRTPTGTKSRKTPTKTPPPKSTTPGGQRTPTLQAFKDSGAKTEDKTANARQQSPQEGRVSRGSRGSKGRGSRASRKTPIEDIVEDENRPFSQADYDPVTQVEIEPDSNQNANASAQKTVEDNLTEQNVADEQNVTGQNDGGELNVIEEETSTNRDGEREEERPHNL